jgi:hypothetical protein
MLRMSKPDQEVINADVIAQLAEQMQRPLAIVKEVYEHSLGSRRTHASPTISLSWQAERRATYLPIVATNIAGGECRLAERLSGNHRALRDLSPSDYAEAPASQRMETEQCRR